MSVDIKKLKVPKGWKASVVGKSCNIHNNLRLPINADDRKEIEGEYPYYGPTGILGYIDHFRVEGEFALIGEDGDHFLKWSKMPMTLLIDGKFNVNNHAHIISGSQDCTTEWFYHFFKHTDITPYLSRQGAGRYKLNKAALEKLPILIPPLPEQNKIAEILSAWDKSIAKTERLIAALRERKKGLMQRLLTSQVRFEGFGEEWKTVRLGEVFSERVERGFDSLPLLSVSENGITYRDDLERRDNSSEDKSKYLRICPGDIGYNTMRMWQGRSALSQYEGIVSPAYTILIPQKEIDARFMAYLFKYQPMIHTFYKYSQGMVSDTWSLKFTAFARIHIRIPALKEQKRIADVLELCDKEISKTQAYYEKLVQHKKGLTQRLLTGEIRVKI